MTKIAASLVLLAFLVHHTKSQSPDCLLPKKTGECKAAHPRWYFDSKANACKPFTYGGCRGNANNFETKDECEDKCLIDDKADDAVTFGANGTGTADGSGDSHVFYCPEAFGHFHDELQCDKYYECEAGVAKEKLCPDGLLFSPVYDDCLYPLDVECGSRYGQQPPRAGIDRRCQRANGFYPDPRQCDLYYECVDGVAHEQLCPDGLLFGQVCDYSFHVDCGDRKLLQKAQSGIDRHCRRANGFYSHDSDCNRYFNCVNGTAYELRCRTGLIFNPLAGDCIKLAKADLALKKSCDKP